MKYDTFCASLKQDEPDPILPPLLQALWWDAKGDWGRAHEIAQAIESSDGAWVHAYLHRKDGDAENARYWYGSAGRQPSDLAMEAEWVEVVESLLARP